IMNTKSQEINEFLDNDLLSSIASAFSSNDNSAIQTKLDEVMEQAQSLGVDPETLPKVIELREQLSSTSSSSNLENEVFSHLANFFKRYYKDGDFVSLRRYKKDTYAIPYEGEEVKLHWANSDQYYIKSGEYFRDYSFKVDNKTIHFKLQEASTEQNNNKGDKRFFIYKNYEELEDELYIYFEYKVAKAHLFPEDIDLAKWSLDTLAPTQINKKRTIFEKHLKSYTSRNSFDYFIHKDLGGFMERELDFYIKNEMLFLDDILDSPIKYEEVMGKIKIFKSVSQKIIAFLTELEELQKKLWEKKKFIIETNYCITLDKIDEEYYEKIFTCKEQLAEWKELFDVDIQSVNDLKEEKYLVLDTKFFDMNFKYKLLSEFDNLDEQIDGVLINSENFGALNLLQNRYKEQIKTVYIDPPYNTGNDGFLYNDNFQHSSWMSFMYDRLALGRELMSDDGCQFSSINDEENINLTLIKDAIFNKKNFISNIIWHSKYTTSNDAKYTSYQHENILFFAKSKNIFKIGLLDRTEKQNKDYKNRDKDIKGAWKATPLHAKSGTEANNFTIIFKNGLSWKPPKGRFHRYSKETLHKLDYNNELYFNSKGGVDKKTYLSEVKQGLTVGTVWNYEEVGHTHSNNEEIANIMLKGAFDNPKGTKLVKQIIKVSNNKNSIILDYFAGSGTTGHAVINLNREDNGKRKYILVEMGEYFNSVTKPRIQKVIYSDSWKDGKPTTKNGISQIFKYFKLESYEDTLNNLEFKRTEEQQKTLDFHPEAKEDYILNYSLDEESQGSLLNIDTFSTPFNYKLKIATSSVGETKDTNIDLVETFNYLLGLVVERVKFDDGFLTVVGKNLKNTKILVIWRDKKSSKELNNFVKKIKLDKYDDIYINGDTNLENVKLIEQEFKRLMFNE
ncbi:MAG: hypothetical protein JJV94_01710, partial [Sulfurospirillum sp.]|nr:hypothetical protein [Sulfurospirillum sp.]